MTSRPVLLMAVASILLAACGGGSDDADATIPDVTLIPTTSETPLFVDGESEEGGAQEDDGVDDGSVAPTSEATTTTAVVTTTIAPTTTAAVVVATVAPEAEAAVPIADTFVLRADGLGAVPFGADPEQSITFVTSILGPPTADTGWLAPIEIGPCGGTRIRQISWNQLQLEFGDVSDVTQGRDHFYSYFYGVEGSSAPQPAGLQTAENIGAGSTVGDLLAAYPGATLFQGDEFVAPTFTVNDNLAGRLSGITDDDVVEVVIGGLPCDG